MNSILTSASKLVFILLALTACVGFFLGKLESKDFMVLAMSAFTFYFSNKGTGDTTGTAQPFLGK
jgi:hypothetical protein